MSEWMLIDNVPEDKIVRTKIHDEDGERNDQPLRKSGNLWWLADGSMYVYYRPTHWMPEDAQDGDALTAIRPGC